MNKENNKPHWKTVLTQGWTFIILIVVVAVAALTGLKMLIG